MCSPNAAAAVAHENRNRFKRRAFHLIQAERDFSLSPTLLGIRMNDEKPRDSQANLCAGCKNS